MARYRDSSDGYYSVKSDRPLDCPEYGRSPEIQAELWKATARVLEQR